jgi:hypothetical protein
VSNFRFYRRVHVFPGLSLNLSKSGPSLTMGMRGAHVTVGSRGVRRTVGIPGSGVFWTSTSGLHSGVHTSHVDTSVAATVGKALDALAQVFLLGLVALFLSRACK